MKKKKTQAKKSVKKETAKKAVKKPAKKTVAKTKILEIKKDTEKPAKKDAPKKTGIKEAEGKKPSKKIKGKAEKTPKKKTTKSVGIKGIGRKELKKIAIPNKKVPKIPERTIGLIATKSAERGRTYPAVTTKKRFPSEYGEDRVTLMVVDPWKLFAYWEVKQATLSKVMGTLALRVYDVTGIYFNGRNANISFDIKVYERVGDSYIGVRPGRDFIVDIGIIPYIGNFVTITRSNKVTTPALKETKTDSIGNILSEEPFATSPTGGF